MLAMGMVTRLCLSTLLDGYSYPYLRHVVLLFTLATRVTELADVTVHLAHYFM